MGKEYRKRRRVVVVQRGVVRGFGAVVYTASLAITPALVRRLQKCLMQLFLM